MALNRHQKDHLDNNTKTQRDMYIIEGKTLQVYYNSQ